MTERQGLKALEQWSKKVTEGYKDVHITNMSHSWRNGLAFCAIIHHYRPDLLNYSCLDKDDILHNNSLAFNIAEQQLGIPALLDAEDMVNSVEPDRLSIATYLSQLYQYFEGGGNKKLGLSMCARKRPSDFKNDENKPYKKITNIGTATSERKYETCQACKNRVFILERLMIDGKLYHRTCFKCYRCDSLLKPGAYNEGEIQGTYECTVCPHDEETELRTREKSNFTSKEIEKSNITEIKIQNKTNDNEKLEKPVLSESFRTARNKFLQTSLRESDKFGNKFKPEESNDKLHLNSFSNINSSHLTNTPDLPEDKLNDRDSSLHKFEMRSRSSTGSPESIQETSRKPSIPQKPYIFRHSSSEEKKTEIDNSNDSRNVNQNNSTSFGRGDQLPTNFDKLYSQDKYKDRLFRYELKPLSIDLSKTFSVTKSNSLINETENQSEIKSSINDQHNSTDENIKTFDLPTIKSSHNQLSLLNKSLPRTKSDGNFQQNSSKLSILTEALLFPTGGKENTDDIQKILHRKWSKQECHLSSTKLLNRSFSSSTDLKHEQTVKTFDVDELNRTSKNITRSISDDKGNSLIKDRINTFLYKNTSNKYVFADDTEQKQDQILFNNVSKSNEIKLEKDATETNEKIVNENEKPESKDLCEIDNKFNETKLQNSLAETSNDDKTEETQSKISNDTKINETELCKNIARTNEINNIVEIIQSQTISEINNSTTVNKLKLHNNIIEVSSDKSENAQSKNDNSNKLNETKLQISIDESNVDILKLKKNEINIDKNDSKMLKQASHSICIDDNELIKHDSDYPTDLNPFGDDDITEETNCMFSAENYPDTLNPFASSDEEAESSTISKASTLQIGSSISKETNESDYDHNLNPFYFSDEEEENDDSNKSNSLIHKLSRSTSYDSQLNHKSSGIKKKKKAPPPPPASVRDIFIRDINTNDESHLNRTIQHTLPKQSPIIKPSPRLSQKKIAPKPPVATLNKEDSKRNDSISNEKLQKINLLKYDQSNDESSPNKTKWKRKKRPAPSVPVPPRRQIKMIPLKEIQAEMVEIEEKQQELENQGRELEVLIRDHEEDTEQSVEEEEAIMQLFELVNQKNALFRRQAELMYIKRSQRLEEEQVEIEFQIRCLMNKSVDKKTDNDAQQETELLQRLLDVVEQRNEIVDTIEMDRKSREAQEDQSIQEHMEQKHIEIKEKWKGTLIKKKEKSKKSKDKKGKKSKKNKDDDEEINKHKKKNWFNN